MSNAATTATKTTSTQPALDLKPIYALVQDDFNAVNQLILNYLNMNTQLIHEIGHHIINSGGKRMRPLLTVLSSHAVGYTGQKHIQLAVIIEFIHTVTLLHDDVVDDSKLRRGEQTANFIWGNRPSILVGDFLYSRAFQLMTELQDLKVMEILADTCNAIANAEVIQLMHCNNPETTEKTYMDVIEGKTAKLFEASTALPALIAQSSDEYYNALKTYGAHLGNAFQLIDDLIDYKSTSATSGKNLGDDLAEGKPTLPLIFALKNAKPAEQALIKSAIRNGGLDHLEDIIAIMEATGGLTYTYETAKKQIEFAKVAIDTLPETPFRAALVTLADFALTRAH